MQQARSAIRGGVKNNIGGKLSAEGISHAKCGEFPLRIGFSPRKPVFACPCCYFLRRLKDLHFKLKKKIAYNSCYTLPLGTRFSATVGEAENRRVKF